jgi:pimeloyl-ACP methyl ester carboxylesterase
MALDGVEVAEFLQRKLYTQKIILVAHSWGTIMGVHMAKARPDLFYAYVGTGQSVNQGQYRGVAYAQLLAEARARQDTRAIRELESIGEPPYDSMAKAAIHTKWANAYEPGQLSTWNLISTVLFESEAGPRDLRDYVRGLIGSQNHFRAAVETADLPSVGSDFAVPFFVFQGAVDDVTPVQPVRGYVDSITAPQKRLVVIPGAGHNVMSTQSDAFLTLLVQYVRPLAIQSP